MNRWVAGALSVAAVAAVAVTAMHLLIRPAGPVTPPGLAGLSGPELVELLPGQDDLPSGWTLDEPEISDAFGYRNIIDAGTTADCSALTGDALTSYTTGVAAHGGGEADPAWQQVMRVGISRDFRPATLDTLAALAARCGSYRELGIERTVTVLDHAEQLRYVSTWTAAGQPPHTSYYSFTPASGLLVTGYTTAEQQPLDDLIAQTLERIHAR